MNNPIALLPPAINVVVTGIFAGVVLSQYLRRHRPYQLYWSIGLLMAFLATLSYAFMLVVSPTSTNGVLLFHVYYIFGILMPAWLGLGSIALVSSSRITSISLTLLYILSLVATILILLATVNTAHLSQIAGTPGTGVLEPGPWLILVILLNTLGVAAVVGVAIYSGLKLLRRQANVSGFRNILWANIFILIGDILNALAGSLARFLAIENAFWLIMAFGWLIFFVGVLFASHRSAATKPVVPEQQSTKAEATGRT